MTGCDVAVKDDAVEDLVGGFWLIVGYCEIHVRDAIIAAKGGKYLPSCPAWKIRLKERLPYCLVKPPVYDAFVCNSVYPAFSKDVEALELMARLIASPPNPARLNQ